MKPENYFKEVSKLVQEGFTISEACDELGIYSSNFYESITKHQKLELNQLRTANKIYGVRGNIGSFDAKELHEFFTTQDYAW